MNQHRINYAELRELLVKLGFCLATHDTTRMRFEHPTTGTVLLFRPAESKEVVNAHDMLVVRRQLVDNGLIEASTFDRFMQSASA